MNEDQLYGVGIKWLSVTCFELRFDGGTVVSDPFVTDSPGTDLTWEDIEGCDIITLSHSHWDHIKDIPRLMERFQPYLMTGQQTAAPVARWLDCEPSRVYPMPPGLELDFDWVKIRALFGRHCNCGKSYGRLMEQLEREPTAYGDPGVTGLMAYGSMEYCNFLFTLPNGTRILIWGNDPTVEQRNMVRPLKPDIAILQLSRQDLVEMADFAKAIGCKVLIPHHMDLQLTEAEYMPRVNRLREEFLSRVPTARFICPRHGQWMEV